jgi:hypothetical protein
MAEGPTSRTTRRAQRGFFTMENTWRQLQAAHPGIRIELTSTCSEGFSPVAALHRKDDEPRGRDMTDSLGAQGDALQRSGLLEQGVGAFGGGA